MTHDDDIAWDDLHPQTQRILSRRGFLGTAGKAAATVTFMGMTMTVVGCSKDETTATNTGTSGGGSSTSKAAAGSSSTTAATTAGTAAAGSLYTKLGGNPAITKVVGDFLGIVVKDDRINSFFAKTDAANLQKQLVNQIGQAAGGPEKYTGRNMKEAHAGLKITTVHFNALVEDLVKALDGAGVGKDLQTPLLDVLGGMKGDIVTA